MEAPQLPMRLSEVAELLGMSYKSVHREVQSGRLKAWHKKGENKIWYVTQADLNEWAEGGMFE